MDRWRGILKVPINANRRARYTVAASLCLSSPNSLSVPSANAIFFNGDRVQGTGNPVIERLSDLQQIAEILVSKLGASINAWVIESSSFNGSFAVYKDFIASVNKYGEPESYEATGFPASTSTVALLSNCLKEVKCVMPPEHNEQYLRDISHSVPSCRPKTLIFGFSKGGTILNQLVTELAFTEVNSIDANTHQVSGQHANVRPDDLIVPSSKEILLNSVAEIHYVDVGLNSSGAYLTNHEVFDRISRRFAQGAPGVRFVLHGTPRQWSCRWRDFIKKEKDQMVRLLKSEAQKCGEKLLIQERFYFAGSSPTLQMHFEIIEKFDAS